MVLADLIRRSGRLFLEAGRMRKGPGSRRITFVYGLSISGIPAGVAARLHDQLAGSVVKPRGPLRVRVRRTATWRLTGLASRRLMSRLEPALTAHWAFMTKVWEDAIDAGRRFARREFDRNRLKLRRLQKYKAVSLPGWAKNLENFLAEFSEMPA